MQSLLTIKQAADVLGVSKNTVLRLIDQAQASPRTAKWKEKRDFVDLTPAGNVRRIIRVLPQAVGLPNPEISKPSS
jgi:hypothetical protein